MGSVEGGGILRSELLCCFLIRTLVLSSIVNVVLNHDVPEPCHEFAIQFC